VSSSSTSPRPASEARRISKIAFYTHGRPSTTADALPRAEKCARVAGVEIVPADARDEADLVLALGGDGTMLRALRATLGSGTPVFGVKYGRVGFLTSADGDRLEGSLAQVFAGDYRVVELCTLAARTESGSHAAVNDVVITSSEPGRMVELGWEIGGEDLGSQPCDGIICCTPSGSTAYNLSNGGPVMMWGLEAMAMTFVAPHSLHARPIVVPRGLDLSVTNRSAEHSVTVLVDGRAVGELGRDGSLSIGLGEETSSLALLPEVTFFGRYNDVFS
jgi:NAD+ kinase